MDPLWIALVIILVVTLILLLIFSRRPVVTTETKVIECQVSLDTLYEVTSTSQYEQCYTLSGVIDPNRYYDNVNNWTIQIQDPSTALPATYICSQFCESQELPNTCVGETPEYHSCMEKIRPDNCTSPAYPVAKRNAQYLYVVGKGKVSCYP